MRAELKILADLVNSGSKVLDIGCGEGELLEYLVQEKKVDGRGLELNQQKASIALSRGLSVVQGDADTDLKYYPDKSFDYAILGQTIQATKNPREILQEMLRIAKYALVSFPNFGYWQNRIYLLFNGRMPVTKTLSYEWYETPNIHFCTIKDFILLCDDMGIKVEKKLFLTADGQPRPFYSNFILPANIFGQHGIFLLGQK